MFGSPDGDVSQLLSEYNYPFESKKTLETTDQSEIEGVSLNPDIRLE